MTIYCKICGKKLGFLDTISGIDKCRDCLAMQLEEKRRLELVVTQPKKERELANKGFEQNRDLTNDIGNNKRMQEMQLVKDYISKFMKGKSDREIFTIEVCSTKLNLIDEQNREIIPKIITADNHTDIEKNIEAVNKNISDYENDLINIRSVKERNENKKTIEILKIYLKFLNDLIKLKKLFESRKIVIKYSEIYDFIIQFIEKKYYNYLKDNFSNEINELKEKIPDRYAYFKEFYKRYIWNQSPYDGDLFFAIQICKIGGFDCDNIEIEELMCKVNDDLEIEQFEKSLGKQTEMSANTINLAQLDGYEFEEFLAQIFEKKGFTVIRTPKAGDQGADLVLENDDGFLTVVQAKKYSGIVSNSAIQEVVAAKGYYNADSAMVVTTGYFSKSAHQLAEANDVILWDRENLIGDGIIYDE